MQKNKTQNDGQVVLEIGVGKARFGSTLPMKFKQISSSVSMPHDERL